MPLFLAVTHELYTFAQDSVRDFLIEQGYYSKTPVYKAPEYPLFPQYVSNQTSVSDVIEPVEESVVEEELPPTFRSTATILERKIERPISVSVPDSESGNRPQKNTVMYTGSESALLYQQPTIEYDGVLARLPYGSLVMVFENRGRWSQVSVNGLNGWILRDDLLDRSAYVYPQFIVGATNVCDDPNTLRTRACIRDEFAGSVTELPLQSSEYVLYRLMRKGIEIAWPNIRPRSEGRWHEVLKGVADVHMGMRPREGMVMEYVTEEGHGHMAYVEAVFPEETISISEANFPNDGIYNERILTKNEWKELRPVFLSFKA